MKKKVQRRSSCPVACTLDIIGDKWTLLVIRDLFLGRTQFREFMASPEGIASNILSDRLRRLVESGLVERTPSLEQTGRDLYRLTESGRTLGPVLQAIVKWGEDNIPGAKARMKPL